MPSALSSVTSCTRKGSRPALSCRLGVFRLASEGSDGGNRIFNIGWAVFSMGWSVFNIFNCSLGFFNTCLDVRRGKYVIALFSNTYRSDAWTSSAEFQSISDAWTSCSNRPMSHTSRLAEVQQTINLNCAFRFRAATVIRIVCARGSEIRQAFGCR